MNTRNAVVRPEVPQYSVSKILLVWAAAALPMAILGWIVAPALALGSSRPVFVRLAALTVGLVWQFVMVALLLSHEAGTWQWSILRKRLWLNTPRSPRTGAPCRRLWWWLIPVIMLTAIFDLRVKRILDELWVSAFPFLAEPAGWSLDGALATPAARSQLVGAWGTGGLFIISAAFNTFLGEELLFRGLLLPRMAGAFAKTDWLANGLLFGIYHLHQPWGIISSVTHGALLFAFPSRYFRTAWFGIAAHSGQSLYFAFLMWGSSWDWRNARMAKRIRLAKTMTEAEFENGYWYATELQEFAASLGVPSARKLRKDEIEKALKHFLRTGESRNLVTRDISKSGMRDVDKGLRLDLSVVHYTSNRETKDFIAREAAKLEPGFKRASGTRYLLNRWREAQIASGRRITYGDLVKQAIRLNKTKRGPLRMAHGRYINFISDFMAANRKAAHADAVRAWKAIKAMDAPKTYEAWARVHRN